MTLGIRLKELRSNEDTSNARTKWTIDEDKKLVQEITEKNYEEIALKHKRTVLSSVRKLIFYDTINIK